jgi:hypothetical protein
MRRWDRGQSRLDTEIFLGIIFSRTAPSFYKITITKAAAQAVEGGFSPEDTTIIRKFTPGVRDNRVSLSVVWLVWRAGGWLSDAWKHSRNSYIAMFIYIQGIHKFRSTRVRIYQVILSLIEPITGPSSIEVDVSLLSESLYDGVCQRTIPTLGRVTGYGNVRYPEILQLQ